MGREHQLIEWRRLEETLKISWVPGMAVLGNTAFCNSPAGLTGSSPCQTHAAPIGLFPRLCECWTRPLQPRTEVAGESCVLPLQLCIPWVQPGLLGHEAWGVLWLLCSSAPSSLGALRFLLMVGKEAAAPWEGVCSP